MTTPLTSHDATRREAAPADCGFAPATPTSESGCARPALHLTAAPAGSGSAGAGPSAPGSPRDRTEHLLAQRELCRTARDREQVEQAVVVLNLPLADSIAGRYAGRGLERDDLVQVARLGLVKAVQRFRPDRGVSFAGFAAPTIAGELKRHFRDTGWMVRPPRRLQELTARMREAAHDLEQALRRAPTVAELARALGVADAEVEQARQAATGFHALSLDSPGSSSFDGTLGETLAEEDDTYGRLEELDWLAAAVRQLSERQRLVLRLRFEDGLTQSQIARRLGVSQMQVSRILGAVLRELRSLLTAEDSRAA